MINLDSVCGIVIRYDIAYFSSRTRLRVFKINFTLAILIIFGYTLYSKNNLLHKTTFVNLFILFYLWVLNNFLIIVTNTKIGNDFPLKIDITLMVLYLHKSAFPMIFFIKAILQFRWNVSPLNTHQAETEFPVQSALTTIFYVVIPYFLFK